jgi:hypothetical protein
VVGSFRLAANLQKDCVFAQVGLGKVVVLKVAFLRSDEASRSKVFSVTLNQTFSLQSSLSKQSNWVKRAKNS